MNEYDKGYDEGFKQGLQASEFTYGYWLRQYAGQAMQGILANPDIMQQTCGSWFKTDASVTMWAVNQAKALLKELEDGKLDVTDEWYLSVKRSFQLAFQAGASAMEAKIQALPLRAMFDEGYARGAAVMREKAAEVAEQQALEPECAERGWYIADAIRKLEVT